MIQHFLQPDDGQPPQPTDGVRSRCAIAVVVPAYNEQNHIELVLRAVPASVRHLIVVDDASTDATNYVVKRLALEDPRIILIRHSRNLGVGGAMVTGFREALKLGAQIVVKIDGDGQMSPAYLPDLIEPLVGGTADFAKGNRFHDFAALSRMPWIRRLGNVALSFLTKAAVGYWNCFDPCNGYLAVRREVLARLDLDQLHHSYFFETSLLSQLYLRGAVVAEVPMPAIYGDEVSQLSVTRVLVEFPPRLVACFARRVLLKHLLFNFSMLSIYGLTAFAMLVIGGLYGGINFLWYASHAIPAPTGTVVIPAMLITLGFQFLLAAINEDLRAVPVRPLCRALLPASLPTAAAAAPATP